MLAIITGLGVNSVFAQEVQVKRNFEAEIQTAIESAKTAAGSGAKNQQSFMNAFNIPRKGQ